ncbi:hypothetical protein [Ferruginibacter sp.]
MKKILLSLCLMAIFTACSKSTDQTAMMPPALEKVIADNSNCICEPFIDQYQWRGQVVYLLAYKGPTCNWIPGYFDKDGVVITMPAGYTLDNFLQESSFTKAVWKCGQN